MPEDEAARHEGAAGPAELATDAYNFAADLVQFLVVPTFVLDASGHVLIWNKACEELTGLRAAEVLGTKDHWRGFYGAPRPCLCDLILYDRMDELDALYESRVESRSQSLGVHAQNWCVMPRLGTELYLAIDAGPIHDASGKVIAVVETLRDMTAHKRLQEELTRLASHDWLTGLVNRRGFDERLAVEWKRAARDRAALSLLMIDVDKFKVLNDQLGHQAGDDCLRRIGGVLLACAARPADLVARYGGEEFAVILASTGADGAHTVASQICTRIAEQQIANGQHCGSASVTVSIGTCTMVPDLDSELSEFVRRADEALYQAKSAGRNRVVQASAPASGHVADAPALS